MSEVLDLAPSPGSYQWKYWESGGLLDLMDDDARVTGHLRILLAVRRYPERSMRLYCERTEDT